MFQAPPGKSYEDLDDLIDELFEEEAREILAEFEEEA
jgi:hypothetical protein